MRELATLIFLSLVPLQEDPAALIEKLRSESFEEREDAAAKLKRLGKNAVPALEKAAKDEDPEVASRAKHLLLVIGLCGTLAPNLMAVMPGVEDELATDDDSAWTRVFLRAAELKEKLQKDDLRVIAARAVRGAATDEEKIAVCRAIWRIRPSGDRELMSELVKLSDHSENVARFEAQQALWGVATEELASEVVKLLRHGNPDIRWRALVELERWRSTEGIEEVFRLLGDTDARVREQSAWAYGMLRAKKATDSQDPAREIARLCAEEDPGLRARAATAFGELRAKAAIPELRKLLDDPDPAVRGNSAEALGNIGDRDSIAKILDLLKKDKKNEVRIGAVNALGLLDAREAMAEIGKLWEDSNAWLRRLAVSALGRMNDRGTVPHLVRFLDDGDPITGWDCNGYLNGFRQPEAWKRFTVTPFTGEVNGTMKGILEDMNEKLRLGLDVEALEGDEAANSDPHGIGQGVGTVMGIFINLLPPDYVLVAEADRIRVVRREKAVEFWRAWAAEQQKK